MAICRDRINIIYLFLLICITITYILYQNAYIINFEVLNKSRNFITKYLRNSSMFIKKENELSLDIVTSRSFLDDTGQYKIISYVRVADNWTYLSKTPICAAVQSSLDRADSIINFINSWDGPVSFAIFAPGSEYSLAMSFIRHLTVCYAAITKQVSFHLVFPLEASAEQASPSNDSVLLDCRLNASSILETLLKLRSNEFIIWRNDLKFPYNMLRNVARKHCQTTYVSCIDIDMVMCRPSPDITPSIMDQLNTFLVSDNATKCDKCAFVIPVFEIDYSVPYIPVNKTELLGLILKNKARQFHIKSWAPNQGSSQLHEKWVNLPRAEGVLVSYQVETFQFAYEPIYIAKRGAPMFDERYVGAGMDRSSQTYEMYLAGYKFYILDNIFLSHWGFKSADDKPKSRQNQIWNNHEKFTNNHLRELAVKYDKDPLNMLKKYNTSTKHIVKILI